MANLDLIRVSIAGSVDDGKSTLLGRLLLETGQIYEDQFAALVRSSDHRGESTVNLAHLTDGLRAEREQNITIDVAYRYMTTATRRFIIADTPGHHQYTRNMVTGASTADAALILVDVQNGVTDQTRRHLFICSILGIPQIAVIVNKMDLVGFRQDAFEAVHRDLQASASRLQLRPLTYIPTSAIGGDAVIAQGENMAWYQGPTVLSYMEGLSPATWLSPPELRIPVQIVVRPDRNFRGYGGRVASGVLRVGDELLALPSRRTATVTSLAGVDGPLEEAAAGTNVMIELDRQVDISRGHLLVRPRNLPAGARAFEAIVCWMSDKPSVRGRAYALRQATREVSAVIADVVYRFDIATYHRETVPALEMNDIGKLVLNAGQHVYLDTYEHNRTTGSFILVDPVTNDVVGAGMVSRVVTGEEAAASIGQGTVVWLTGLSGAGKSTIADALAERMRLQGAPVARLDGDDLRGGLNADLGFSTDDRRENLRRAAHVARLFARAGNITICSFITPLEADRQLVREVVGEHYFEVFVNTSLATCETRDPKGHYKRARAGKLPNFTGIDAPFEPPTTPELTINTENTDVEAAVREIVAALDVRPNAE